MIDQELHLVSEDIAVGQDQMFHPARSVRHREQRHFGLLRRAIALAQIARQARADHVLPFVTPPFGYRQHVVTGKFAAGKLRAAVHAQKAVTREQRGVGQRRRRIHRLVATTPGAGDDGVQLQQALRAMQSTETTVHEQARIAERPRDGATRVQADSVLPADPVQDMPGRIQ